MQFKVVSAFAFATLVAAVNGPVGPSIIPPAPGNPLPVVHASACDSGRLRCCKAAQEPTGPSASDALGRLGIPTGTVGGLVGLNCSPTTVARGCSSTPLCCTDNSHGSVSLACNRVS